ncbi:MAG: type III PLP-dependent enzyme [Alphaproteobacteria bacterium]
MNDRHMQGSALPYPYSSDECKDSLAKVAELRPAKPLYIVMPDVVEQTARDFISAFPGKALFAVKTNPSTEMLETLGRAGVYAFDVASLDEIRRVKGIWPHAELHFMHTVKAPEDIRSAYFDYGVRHFVLDHEDELYKIMRETELAQDLSLTVRISLPKNDSAQIDFSSKFGATLAEAACLLEKCRPVSQTLGISFHVGSQTTDPKRYGVAIGYCAALIKDSGIKVDSLNVGGGFPVPYVGDEGICRPVDCIKAIEDAVCQYGLEDLDLLCEPGRALVARGAQLVARVELRKGHMLYINDGVYGGLFDAGKWLGTRYPVSAVSCDRAFDGQMDDFRLAGPTCDSIDMMEGPFRLPSDIGMGDWIVFDNVGAYSQTLRSDFNGFGHYDVVVV